MQKIDIASWSRRDHFHTFNAFDYPHFGLCANVDLTTFHPFVKARGHSIHLAIVYVLARAANEIPEFRHRIRGEEVVVHAVVHPSPTILTDKELFSYCTMEYDSEFAAFARQAEARMAYVRAHPTLEDEPDQDDLLFMTAIPWVSFTSFTHPVQMHPVDSVPRISWGKFIQDANRIHMPLSVQAHHALMDGLHIGRYYETVQEYLDNPAIVLALGSVEA